MSTLGDIMSTLGVLSTPRGYHNKSGVSSLRKQLNLNGNPSVLMVSPTLMVSSDVLIVSPSVLNTP